MYLKSLTLKGFKSFADRSVVSVEPGVTCIVGPNGSGKSNITDAILWVLGEQSAKMLRGSSMEDVIFSGSSARRGVGVAEVDLVLDNSDHTIPLEFNEITFTRRMYRSGESEYLINQAPARLMDILDLLHDSGLGREMHSVISQGRIDEILKSKPEERRTLVEEAAGILKHKKRKERALRRLVALDAHLERARDIVSEIDRQLRPLQRQANRAEQQKDLARALRDIEIALAVDDLRGMQTQWEAVLKREKETQAQIDIAQYQLKTQSEELEKLQLLLEEKGLFVGDLSEQRRKVSATLQRLEGIVALVGEKEKNILSKIDELEQRVDEAKGRIDAARTQTDELAQSRSETEGKLKALYARLSDLRRESEALRKTRSALDETLVTLQNDQRTTNAQADRATVNQSASNQAIRALETQKAMLVERLATLDATFAISAETLHERRAKRDELEEALTKMRREMTLAQSDIDKRVRVVETRKKDADRTHEELVNTRAQLKGLEDLNNAMRSVTPDNARLLQQVEKNTNFRGRIMEVLHVEPGLEDIVEQLLGSDVWGIFVSSAQGAHDIVKDALALSQCDMALVPLQTTLDRLCESSIGTRITDSITCDAQYSDALVLLLGDVFLVDSIDEALTGLTRHKGIRYVTRDGVVVWPSGKITVGSRQIDREGALHRHRRVLQLKQQIPHLENMASHNQSELEVAQKALVSAQQDAFEVGQRLAALSGEHGSMILDLTRSEESFNAMTNERDTLNLRCEEIDREMENTLRQRADLDTEIARYQQEATRYAEEIVQTEADRDSRFAEETRLLTALNECQIEIAQAAERDLYMKRSHAQASDEADRLEKVISSAASVRDELETMRQRVAPLHVCCKVLHEKATHLSDSLTDRAQFEQTDSVSLRDTIHAAQENVRQSQEHVAEHRETLALVRVEKGQLDVHINTAVRALLDDHGVPLEVALELPPLQDRPDGEGKALALRKKLTGLGVVNPIAMQEYTQLKERSDFMRAQMDDLVQARKTLGKVVSAIDRKMRERFLDTLEAVDTHFQEVFATLFPGGSAQLVLTDPDQIDQSGVEYIVQPRGKKVRKMSLLSGGEHSLAALALLFALNEVRPCPFFVLDEVEASLDDSNLRRFVGFIGTMRTATQFLIVTHQRRTMEMADLLYGVSMQSDGVSKLVSQRLEGTLEMLGYDPDEP